MRCLPDSLDIVTLTNADNFSKFDAEDMDVMREKGTKVLYQVDYAARAEEFADMQALDAYLDQVVAAVAANGMDGYSFTTNPLATDATARIVEKLAAAKSEGQLLVFEGNPLSLAAADRPKVDFIALDTEKLEKCAGGEAPGDECHGVCRYRAGEAAAGGRDQRTPAG